MASCCIALTTDLTYLFPTIVSAMTARQHASADLADVFIFTFGCHGDGLNDVEAVCEKENLHLIGVDDGVIECAPAMLARLFLDRYVPGGYEHLLYLDSDILVTGPLDSLLKVHLPEGCFLAANDPLSFLADDDSRMSKDHRARMHRCGFTREMASSYFNSGVLRMDRAGWKQTGEAAWAYIARNKDSFFYPDQDAINLAGYGKRLPLSLRWNYPMFLQNARVKDQIEPRIQHFMSRPKPWHGSFAPWTQREHDPYVEALRKYPQLSRFSSSLRVHKRLKYSLQQRYKQARETFEWGFSQRRERIFAYERACYVLPAD